MRRFLLILTFISFAGWSLPAQQQAQPPTTQQTPASWIHLAELAVPGIVGIAGALFAVLLTNRYNAATNAANRKHELEKLNREHSFTLKRDVLIHVTQSLVQTLAALKLWDGARSYLEYMEANGECTKAQAEEEITQKWSEYILRRTELEQATAAACLAVSDDLWKSAQAVGAFIAEARKRSLAERPTPFEQADEQIAAFTKAARRELGIVHIDA